MSRTFRLASYGLSLFAILVLVSCAPAEVQGPLTPTRSQLVATTTLTEIPILPSAVPSPSPEGVTTGPTQPPDIVIRLGQIDRVTVTVNDRLVVQAPAGQWVLTYNPALVELLTEEKPDVTSWQFQALAPGVTPITADMEPPPCEGEFCPPAPAVQFSLLLEISSP